ncbi:MAG: hypothetical protein J7K98_03415 [Candidatus Aenigmarchaeota archaeon]|nr:hypothetical protein [Candidatus Aenigmarchaeota archaeon]
MKTINLVFTLLFFCLLVGEVVADGFILPYDYDVSGPLKEHQQLAAIKFENGFERMLIAIDIQNSESKAVWIFPLPSDPSKVVVDVAKSFPDVYGKDVKSFVRDRIKESAWKAYYTQLYPFFFRVIFFPYRSKYLEAGKEFGVNVHEHLEKEGIVVELITAKNGTTLYDYLQQKGLRIQTNSIPVIDEYIGKDFSFVLVWIPEKTTPKIFYCEEPRPQACAEYYDPVCGSDGNTYSNGCFACTNKRVKWYRKGRCEQLKETVEEMPYLFYRKIGVEVTFPTEKLFYPLLPTSVYGSEKIKATILVDGAYVPELYDELLPYTDVRYLSLSRSYYVNEERWFKENSIITKIVLNAPSKYYVKDLSLEKGVMPDYLYAVTLRTIAFNDYVTAFFLILVSSFISGYISGLILFRKPLKFGIVSLSNLFSIIGVIVALCLVKAGTRDLEEDIRKIRRRNKFLILVDVRKVIFVFLFSFLFLLSVYAMSTLLLFPL